jgi:hypothetical protein
MKAFTEYPLPDSARGVNRSCTGGGLTEAKGVPALIETVSGWVRESEKTVVRSARAGAPAANAPMPTNATSTFEKYDIALTAPTEGGGIQLESYVIVKDVTSVPRLGLRGHH